MDTHEYRHTLKQTYYLLPTDKHIRIHILTNTLTSSHPYRYTHEYTSTLVCSLTPPSELKMRNFTTVSLPAGT